MKVRRVITGHSGGRSTFASDGPTRKSRDFVSVPGMSCALLWSTPTTPVVPHDRADSVSAGTTYLPQVGETRLMLVTFPPDSVMISDSFDQAAAGQEYMEHIPDLAAKFEPDNPGMHTTDTVGDHFRRGGLAGAR